LKFRTYSTLPKVIKQLVSAIKTLRMNYELLCVNLNVIKRNVTFNVVKNITHIYTYFLNIGNFVLIFSFLFFNILSKSLITKVLFE